MWQPEVGACEGLAHLRCLTSGILPDAPDGFVRHVAQGGQRMPVLRAFGVESGWIWRHSVQDSLDSSFWMS